MAERNEREALFRLSVGLTGLEVRCLPTKLRRAQVQPKPSPFGSTWREFPHLDSKRHGEGIRECAACKNCKN